jgi:aminoglycoside 6'-N-acetyltransferase
MAASHVARWWRERSDPQAIDDHDGPIVDDTDPTEIFIVRQGSRPMGLVQRYTLDDNVNWQTALSVTGTPLHAFGIDYLIGAEDLIGRGMGPRMLEQFVDDSWRRFPECPACVVGVHQDNRRSWRALEKAGFVRAWSGFLDSDDPSDAGPEHVYLKPRPADPPPAARHADPAGEFA